MDIPTLSLEFLKTGWNWTIERLELWIELLRDPLERTRSIDINSTSAIVDAVQFAVFPLALTTIITLPLYLAIKDHALGFTGYLIAATFDNCALLFVYAIAQRAGAIIMRGKATFNACLVVTLYASAFFPLVGLEDYVMMGRGHLYSKVLTDRSLDPAETTQFLFDSLFLLALAIYLTFRFVPVTRHVQKVGTFRAIAIIWLTMFIGGIIGDRLLGSLEKLLQISESS